MPLRGAPETSTRFQSSPCIWTSMFSWTSPKCIGLVAHVQQDPDELRSSTGSFDNSYGGVKICDFSFTDLLHLQCPTSLYGRTRNLWIDSGGTPCSSSQHTFEVFAKPHISVRNLTKTTPICVVVSHTHSLNHRTVSKHTSVGFTKRSKPCFPGKHTEN